MSTTKQIATYVGAKVAALQGGYLPTAERPRPTAAAAAALATLRLGSVADPAEDPACWEVTLDAFPEELMGNSDMPSPAEQAVHAALVLYARHQQGRTEPMYQTGISLGLAVRDLARKRGDEGNLAPSIVRRFQFASVAAGFAQRAYHLRALVDLMRTEKVPLDYARLAADLYRLSLPAAADSVRLRWGRDLYRPIRAAETNG